MNSEAKLKVIRSAMAEQGLSAWLQPVHDEYLNEYPPACNRRVEWLTGFSGSAGPAAVLPRKAALFTDGRYTLQAQNEVDAASFERHNISDQMPEAWLAGHLSSGDRVGYDPRLYTQDMLRRMGKALGKKGVELVPVENLVDQVWKDRPPAPSSRVFIHDDKYAGETSASRRGRMAAKLKELGAEAAVLTAPDGICWLLNIRGRDIENTPLVLARAILDAKGKVRLYINPARCSPEVCAHLGAEVELCDPAALESGLAALGREKRRVLCDPASAPVWFTQVLADAGADIVEAQDPTVLAKAIKNPVELQGMRDAHIRDGVAVVKLLAWLDHETAEREVSEIEVGEMLLSLRESHPMFREPSFPTIAGSGPHGAIVHYRATPESNRALRPGELFLLDSGGQYPDGTTDITRTVPIGTPSAEHKERFARVLKGHIALATAVFPEGTAGSQLDALARQYLWQAGLDYDHGTGHGVGHFLGVHEG
ncbi:MAG: aminopeptidase P family protein, partial [Pseudomonadota bacterium]|nr:aminopeptidase P family protein [Pseudomonadota bacterium]